MSEKTEEPTPRRLREARAEGQSGASAYASSAFAFLVGLAIVPAAVGALVAWSTEHLRGAIAHAHDASAVDVATSVDPGAIAWDVASLSLPLVAGIAAVTVVAQLVQTRGAFTPKRLAPRLDRLSPLAGLARVFSGARLFAVARGLLGAGAAIALADFALRAHLVDLARLPGRLSWAGAAAGAIAQRLAWSAALVGVALAALDALVTWRTFRRGLRMSKDEVKRHHKESEGDPEMKRARRRASEEMLASTAIARVEGATLVVSGARLACALRYVAGETEAPLVVASGRGELAEAMLRAAREHGVAVAPDARLARALLELSEGDPIPEALYDAVALLLRDAAG